MNSSLFDITITADGSATIQLDLTAEEVAVIERLIIKFEALRRVEKNAFLPEVELQRVDE